MRYSYTIEENVRISEVRYFDNGTLVENIF